MASFIERLIKYNEHFLIDDYKLDGATPEQAQLGQGAFGRVYSVYHEVRDNTGVTRYPAAVKIIALDHDSYFRNLPQDSEERVNRNLSKEQRWIDRQLAIVQNEIRIMHGLLGEVNIVYCMRFDYKYFKADGLSCCDVVILMEKLVTLKQYLKDNVPDSDRERLKQVLKIWRHLAAALMICDKRQILHLDIKPDNIFYAPGPDNFKLSDFGISMEGRTFKPGVRRGTFDYMAPEMFDKLGGDNRADMYSLAIVIYELLNDHRLPFQKTDGSYEDRRQAQAERLERKRTVPALSRVPGDVNEVLLKCLEVNPDKRYSDVGALFNVVEYIYYKYAHDGGKKRLPWPVILGGAAVAAAAGVLVFIMLHREPPIPDEGPTPGPEATLRPIVVEDFDANRWYSAQTLPELRFTGDGAQVVEVYVNDQLAVSDEGLSGVDLRGLGLASGENRLSLRYAEGQGDGAELVVRYDPDVPVMEVEPEDIDESTGAIRVRLVNEGYPCAVALLSDGERLYENTVNGAAEIPLSADMLQRLRQAGRIALEARDAAGNVTARALTFRARTQLRLEGLRFDMAADGARVTGSLRTSDGSAVGAEAVRFQVNGNAAGSPELRESGEAGVYTFELAVPDALELRDGDALYIVAESDGRVSGEGFATIEMPAPTLSLQSDQTDIEPGEPLTGRVTLEHVQGMDDIRLVLYIDGASASGVEFNRIDAADGRAEYSYAFQGTAQFEPGAPKVIKVSLDTDGGAVFSDEARVNVAQAVVEETEGPREAIGIANAADFADRWFSRRTLPDVYIHASAGEFLEVRYNGVALNPWEAESDDIPYAIEADRLIQGENTLEVRYEQDDASAESVRFYYDSVAPDFDVSPRTVNEKTERIQFTLNNEEAACTLAVNVGDEVVLNQEIQPGETYTLEMDDETRAALLGGGRVIIDMIDRAGNETALEIATRHLARLTLEAPDRIAARESGATLEGTLTADVDAALDAADLEFDIDGTPVEGFEWIEAGNGYAFSVEIPEALSGVEGEHMLTVEGDEVQRAEAAFSTVTPELSLALDQTSVTQGERVTISGAVRDDSGLLTADDFELRVNGKTVNATLTATEGGWRFSFDLEKVRLGMRYDVSAAAKGGVIASVPDPVSIEVVDNAPITLDNAEAWNGEMLLDDDTDVVLSGTAEPGKRLTLFVNDAAADETAVGASGEYDMTLFFRQLRQGANTVALRYADGGSGQAAMSVWLDTVAPVIQSVSPEVIDQNTDLLEVAVDDTDPACAVRLMYGNGQSTTVAAVDGVARFENLRALGLSGDIALDATDRTGHVSETVTAPFEVALENIHLTLEPAEGYVLVQSMPDCGMTVTHVQTQTQLSFTTDGEGFARLPYGRGVLSSPEGGSIRLVDGENAMEFRYASYKGEAVDSRVMTRWETYIDREPPEFEMDSGVMMAGVTSLSGTVLNEARGWTAELLSGGAQIDAYEAESGETRFGFDIPEGTDLTRLSLKLTDLAGNSNELFFQYTTVAPIEARLEEDRVYADGRARIVGTAQPGATVIVESRPIHEPIVVDKNGVFEYELPVTALEQGDNAIDIYYDEAASGFTSEAAAGTALLTPIVVRRDSVRPNVTVTPTTINRDTGSVHVDVRGEQYGWTVALTEDGETLFEQANATDISIDPSWSLQEERNDRNRIEIIVTDAAGNQTMVPMEYHDSSENYDALAFSRGGQAGVIHNGETLALEDTYIVCNTEDMPGYVTLSLDNYRCEFEYEEADLDEAVARSGQTFSSYADAAYRITGITLGTNLPGGSYALQAMIETEHGDAGPYDLGTVTVEAVDTSTFKSSFTLAEGGKQSGLTPDRPSQNSFRAGNVVLTGSIAPGVNIWNALGYFGLQNEDGASIIQYKGNTVSMDALKVHMRDGRADGGFVLSLDLNGAERTLANGIYTLRFYTKDEETDEYVEILTAKIMIDDTARAVNPESESLRVGWNPTPTPMPTETPQLGE